MSNLRLWPRCSPLGGRGSQTPTSLPSPWQVSVPNLVALTETEWYKRKHGFQKSEPCGRFSGYSESNHFQTDMQWKFDSNPTEQARCFPLSRRLWKDHAWCDQLTTDELFQFSLKFQAVKFQVLTSGLVVHLPDRWDHKQDHILPCIRSSWSAAPWWTGIGVFQ